MAWRVRVTPTARTQWQALDAGLREEIALRVIEMCDDPFSVLRRSSSFGEPPGLWVLECGSELDAALCVRLYFGEVVDGTDLVLVAIGTLRGDVEED